MLCFGSSRGAFAPALLATAALLLAACGDDPEVPSDPNPDEALECLPPGMDAGPVPDGGPVLACASGEVCVQGRCYAPCEGEADCGPRETCGDEGVCVRRAGPEPDAGSPPDAGPAMPCDDVTCEAPLVCHPPSGECVECSEETLTVAPGEPGYCSGLRPICDIANGTCVAANPAQCAPCITDDECIAGDESFEGRCVDLTALGDVPERVCAVPCADADPSCPPGLTCDSDREVCLPPAGSSCTTWRAATERRACLRDEQCNPLGASAAFFTGACQGETVPMIPDAGPGEGGVPIDAGPTIEGTCAQPCGVDDDCFDVAGGQMCLGSGAMLFCGLP
ncbi:MAG TPA: hypothetical protein RMH99_09160 [Sandaracinaceae bacterium LLY-WYZ-13_1]|nr:hypothetical protein [Sandaracinaceae bacterium LLY-WYZ-13_1]